MINLGRTLADSDRREEALDWFNRVIDSGFRFAEPYLARGSLFADMGRYEEAFRDFEEAAEIRPDYPETWNNMGAILGEQKRFAEAVEVFRRAFIVDPQNKETIINLAIGHYFLKDYENARKYAKLAKGFGVILPEYLASALKL